MALKAAFVNNPPDSEEGRLYREIGRSKIAPQGICAVNPAGKVLAWALMFDDDRAVLAFLDHALRQFARFPGADKPVAAERYMRFPSQRLEDAPASRDPLPAPDRHAQGSPCPALSPYPEGTITARVFGRALDSDGKPVADATRQENYAEDRFSLLPDAQADLARALRNRMTERVLLPEAFTRPLLAHAYLGVLDVQPVSEPGAGPLGARGQVKKSEFHAQPVEGKRGMWRVDGESEVYNDALETTAGPGDLHGVKLSWRGYVEIAGDRILRLALTAEGSERLKYNSARPRVGPEVAMLPGGRSIDLRCRVRYGVVVTGRANE